MKAPVALMAVSFLALAACGDDPAATGADDGREASGEVLEGTISDAMLPIDEVRSQAPLAEPDPEEAGEGGAAATAATPAEDAPAEDAPVAEEPAPEAAEPAAAE